VLLALKVLQEFQQLKAELVLQVIKEMTERPVLLAQALLEQLVYKVKQELRVLLDLVAQLEQLDRAQQALLD